jgi:hypothetical protein
MMALDHNRQGTGAGFRAKSREGGAKQYPAFESQDCLDPTANI